MNSVSALQKLCFTPLCNHVELASRRKTNNFSSEGSWFCALRPKLLDAILCDPVTFLCWIWWFEIRNHFFRSKSTSCQSRFEYSPRSESVSEVCLNFLRRHQNDHNEGATILKRWRPKPELIYSLRKIRKDVAWIPVTPSLKASSSFYPALLFLNSFLQFYRLLDLLVPKMEIVDLDSEEVQFTCEFALLCSSHASLESKQSKSGINDGRTGEGDEDCSFNNKTRLQFIDLLLFQSSDIRWRMDWVTKDDHEAKTSSLDTENRQTALVRFIFWRPPIRTFLFWGW